VELPYHLWGVNLSLATNHSSLATKLEGEVSPYAAIGVPANTRLPPLRGLSRRPRNAPLGGTCSPKIKNWGEALDRSACMNDMFIENKSGLSASCDDGKSL